MNKIFLFYNPGAGYGQGVLFKQTAQQWCDENDWVAEIHTTAEEDDYKKILQSKLKDKWDYIGVAGGDGTISLVVSALVSLQAEIPLLIIPIGSGNLLAKNFYYPTEIRKCLDLLKAGSENRQIDVMKVNEHYRILNAGVGFNSSLMKNTTRDEKRRFGILAYFKNIWNTVKRTHQVTFMLTIDGLKEVIHGADVFVANAGFGLHIKPEEEYLNPSDGVISLYVTKPSTVSGLFQIIGNVLKGKKRGIEVISRFEFRKELIIETDHPVLAQSDGEVIGFSPLTIRLMPSSLMLVVPVRTNPLTGLVSKIDLSAKNSP